MLDCKSSYAGSTPARYSKLWLYIMVQRTCLYGACECRSEVESDYCPNHQIQELITMKFENPLFYPGIQNTIRVGTKWFESDLLSKSPDTRTNHNETDIAIFEVVGLMRCRLDEIPNRMLELNHDGACHSLAGVVKNLKRMLQ